MIVDPQLFVDTMEHRWLSYPATHPRVCTPALRRLWERFAGIFDAQLQHAGGPRPVIPAELGAGKTTAMKVWASMLPIDAHPGLLLVVRTVRAAEQVVKDINDWAGRTVAYAYHSELPTIMKHDLAGLAWRPVLVVCHAGYETSLNRFAMTDSITKFEAFHRFREGRRRLVFVDESLDLIYQARLKLSELEYAEDKIPSDIKRTHLAAYDVLASVKRAILGAPRSTRMMLSAAHLLFRADATPEQADALLRAMWEEGIRGAKQLDRDTRMRIGDVLTSIRHHLALYRWADGDASIAGARLLLPPEAALVVLDASGRLNSVYQRSPFFHVIDDLEPVRFYDAATQYVIRARGTGIRAMGDEDEGGRGEEIAQETLDLVLGHYCERARERRVLIVTNKKSEAKVRAVWETAGFASLDVIHWGDIDGRSDLSHCDTLVTLTLPYSTLSHDLAVHLALTGDEPDDAGLNNEPDDVRALREVRVAGQLAQAMGRICIRDLTREDGVCEPADLFTRLPYWDKVIRTDVVLEHVQRVLRGLKVVELAAEPYRDLVALYGHFFTKPGLLKQPADVPKRTWMRLLKDARHPEGQIHQMMTAADLEVARAGGRLYVQAKGTGAALTPSERAVLDFAKGIEPGQERPLSECGLPEDARRKALRKPRVAAELTATGIVVERRGPHSGGLVLRRPS